MSLRQKLLLLFSLTVILSVATVGWTVSARVRKVFDQIYQEQTAQQVSQFRLELDARSQAVADTLSTLAGSERMTRVAQELALNGDTTAFVTEAGSLAKDSRLDYLEIVGSDGSIISSAQWPARFGYPEPAAAIPIGQPFLKREDLPDGSSAVGLFAMRRAGNGSAAITLIGGRKLDQATVGELPVPAGTNVYFYSEGTVLDSSTTRGSEPARLAAGMQAFRPLIEEARKSSQPATSLIYLTRRREDSVNATAIPLKSSSGSVLAFVVIATSRRGMVEAQNHIRAIAFGVAAAGILFAIAASLWIAARISRPIEQLARAAERVAQGDWATHVEMANRWLGEDEISVLQNSFNHMTGQLVDQREQLVQTERVAAWRELARRLAHELKNPLFPLQLTVENLVRARRLEPAEFDEVFSESTRTLSMEIANLKSIIGRFSDFSKMPKPQEERIDACELLAGVHALYSVASPDNRSPIQFNLRVPAGPVWISADADLLHRALSNLVLNAMDSMANMGKDGTLTLGVARHDDKVRFRVADSGKGMTPEERERIFTPYYTTKEFGTGLGLAIVQSVVSDHHGTITVESSPDGGTTFLIDLPAATDGEEAA